MYVCIYHQREGGRARGVPPTSMPLTAALAIVRSTFFTLSLTASVVVLRACGVLLNVRVARRMRSRGVDIALFFFCCGGGEGDLC
jgi:hypothetical protein